MLFFQKKTGKTLELHGKRELLEKMENSHFSDLIFFAKRIAALLSSLMKFF